MIKISNKYILVVVLLLCSTIVLGKKDISIFLEGPYSYQIKPNKLLDEKILLSDSDSKYVLVIEDGRSESGKDLEFLKANLNSKEILNLKMAKRKSRMFDIPLKLKKGENNLNITALSSHNGFIGASIMLKELPVVKKVIGVEGGEIELSNYVKIFFQKDSFTEKTTVELALTRSEETSLDYYSTMVMQPNLGPRIPYEIRILIEKNELKKPLRIEANIPKGFLDSKSIKQTMAFGLIFQKNEYEVLDSFESLTSRFDSSKRVLEITYPSNGFTDSRRTDGKKEAIIVISAELQKDN